MRVAACLYVKDEAAIIAEWIAHHAEIGVDHFIIYDNMSTDETASILAQCSAVFPMTVIRWNIQSKFAQQEAYEHCIQSFRLVFDWISFTDADEFIVPVRDRSISALLRRLDNASAVACNWAMFGSSGHVAAPPSLTVEAFKRRAPDDFPPNRHVKMIVRPHLVTRVVSAHWLKMDGPVVSPDGRITAWISPGRTAGIPNLSICRVNHYFTRSREHWDRKLARGYRDFLRDPDTFADNDRNEIFDDSACAFLPGTKAALGRIGMVPNGFETIDPSRTHPDPHTKGSPEWRAMAFKAVAFSFPMPTAAATFDPDWYARHNPEVPPDKLDEHFWSQGIHEGRDPNAYFDSAWYTLAYPDVAQAKFLSFSHYVNHGAREGRRPSQSCKARAMPTAFARSAGHPRRPVAEQGSDDSAAAD